MIRAAGADDASALARIQRRGWLHAYAGFVDPEVMTAHPIEASEDRWGEMLANPATATWVWDQGGPVAGFATVGPSRDDDAAGDTGELYAIYVDPHAQGAGLGTVLLARAVEGLRERGWQRATLWTFEANSLARRFYERHGWVPEPESAGLHAEDWAPSIRYRREL